MENSLAELALSDEALRVRAAWQLSWNKYLARHVTPQVLEAYFNTHPTSLATSSGKLSLQLAY